MAEAFRRLYEDEAERQRLAKGALRKAITYTWPETGAFVARIYDRQVATTSSGRRAATEVLGEPDRPPKHDPE